VSQGLNGLGVDQYLSRGEPGAQWHDAAFQHDPFGSEERPTRFAEIVFSRLIMDRIVFLGTAVDVT
jgi:ATP-dependent Clp protease protease subunit